MYKRTIDSDGNKYVIDAHSHANRGDTIRIYDKNYRLVHFGSGSGTHFYPKYEEMGNGSIRTLYTKFDYKGNWINSETYFSSGKTLHSKLEREINYY